MDRSPSFRWLRAGVGMLGAGVAMLAASVAAGVTHTPKVVGTY